MKQKDIALIVGVIGISVIVSALISYFVFGTSKTKPTSVEVVPVITSDFNALDKNYFGNQPIDPTSPADVGSQNNPNPF